MLHSIEQKSGVTLDLGKASFNKTTHSKEGRPGYNPKYRNFITSKLNDRLKWIDENITEFMKEMDKCDKEDGHGTEYTKEQLQ